MTRGAHPQAHTRILTTLASLDTHDPSEIDALARALLRRLDEDALAETDPVAVARWISDVGDRLTGNRPGQTTVVVHASTTGLDGHSGIHVVEVMCDDRPFLLATITDEIERRGGRVMRSWHPILGVARAPDGSVTGIQAAREAEHRIAVIRLEFEGPSPDGGTPALDETLRDLVADVVRATDDFPAMCERLGELASELRFGAWSGLDDVDAGEVADLLDWLLDGNLVLLGVRDYTVDTLEGTPSLRVVDGSGLGLLRDSATSRFVRPVPLTELPEETRNAVSGQRTVSVGRTRRASTVRRRERMQQFSFVRRDDDGDVAAVVRVLGLFTRKALAEPVAQTPLLRRKLETILDLEDVVARSHDEAIVVELLQALPKDELFELDTHVLHELIAELAHAEERGDVRVRIRESRATSTVSVLVAVPRDRYGPQLRSRLQEHLTARYGAARVHTDVAFGDRRDALVRVLLQVDGELPAVSHTELHRELRELTRSWIDDVYARLRTHELDSAHLQRLEGLADRLPAGYRDVTSVDDAVADLLLLDRLERDDEPLLVDARRDGGDCDARIRVARRGAPLVLSAFMPVLESLGLTVVEEVPHNLAPPGEALGLHDFGVRSHGLDPQRDGQRLAAAVLAAWRGHLIVDSLNALVLRTGVDWREVAILRAFTRLRRQLGTHFTPEYVNRTLVEHPDVVELLVAHIRARFDPDLDLDEQTRAEARDAVMAACDALERLDDDRILRGLVEVVDATVRTNAFRDDALADGTSEPYIAIKLDPSRLEGLDAAPAYREVYVHSPRVEGIHVRHGPVARGGLRWSDRRDDVRAEVGDLVRAQVLKNALIVPAGAKGGFVPRAEPADPSAARDEARRQYVTFVRGLLDVTDNLEGDTVVAPPRVVRHDGDDPYLVVAADRGTATFSDVANDVARRYGFWLDDAFASGGSNGYDHKELGVTARGAWLAVRRHFRELGIDVQSESITIVGVGDMSGDVFGNGMLQSRAIRLVAAFDHRDIFLDPDPDPERSFDERKRLFELPRSSWQDYDRDAISSGGGVFSRDARSVPLSNEIREFLRVDDRELPPPALIRAILRAPADLLFAGGIGTYLKASSERHEDVADRTNDELRVDARDVRARVIGEGANLFATQRARIEYARRGGHVNQDAIDNAAGVATSDLEVNTKMLLTLAQNDGRLDVADRDPLLAELADDVVARVMLAVDGQAAALSREATRSPDLLDAYDRMMDRLAASHSLDRDAEVLPSSAELDERTAAGAGLTRPELATLLAWSKRELKESLLADTQVDTDVLSTAIAEYFPARVVERFGALLPHHRLRREIVATTLANDVTDRMGVTFVARLVEATGATPGDVVVAYRLARGAIDAPELWRRIDGLDTSHDTSGPDELLAGVERVLVAVTTGLVTHPRIHSDPAGLALDLGRVATQLRASLLDLGTADQRHARNAYARWLRDDLVEPELATFLAIASDLTSLPEVTDVTVAERLDPSLVADVFLRVGEGLAVDRLEDLLARLKPEGVWARRQRDGVAAELRRARRDATMLVLRSHDLAHAAHAVEQFVSSRQAELDRVARIVRDLTPGERLTLDGVAVAARAVTDAIHRPSAHGPR